MLYKNVKFNPHPLETVHPSQKKHLWKCKIPMFHITSSHLNPIFKEPPPPRPKKQFRKKKKKKHSTLYLKIPLERGEKKSALLFLFS
jgi:hypothetical protein